MKTTLKNLSSDGEFCVQSSDLFPVPNVNTPNYQHKIRNGFLKNHDIYVCDGRAYTPVRLNINPMIKYWMDCVTGTLFNIDGTRTIKAIDVLYCRPDINVKNMKRDDKEGADLLLKKNEKRKNRKNICLS